MQTFRFPYLRQLPNVAPAEVSQIITLAAGVTSLALGGEQSYTSIVPWKTAGDRNTEAPYPCVALEFSGSGSGIIGNGTTELIGLFGQIDLTANPTIAANRRRTLLAILGLNLGAALPQIPLVAQAGPASDLVGYTQLVSNIAVYDRLSIGGVLADVFVPEGLTLTVVARPIRRRDYLG